jgi:transposase
LISKGKESVPAVDGRFAISHQVVQKIKYQYRDIGCLQRQPQKAERKRMLTERQCERICQLIGDNPSLTLEQLKVSFKVDCCLMTT